MDPNKTRAWSAAIEAAAKFLEEKGCPPSLSQDLRDNLLPKPKQVTTLPAPKPTRNLVFSLQQDGRWRTYQVSFVAHALIYAWGVNRHGRRTTHWISPQQWENAHNSGRLVLHGTCGDAIQDAPRDRWLFEGGCETDTPEE